MLLELIGISGDRKTLNNNEDVKKIKQTMKTQLTQFFPQINCINKKEIKR